MFLLALCASARVRFPLTQSTISTQVWARAARERRQHTIHLFDFVNPVRRRAPPPPVLCPAATGPDGGRAGVHGQARGGRPPRRAAGLAQASHPHRPPAHVRAAERGEPSDALSCKGGGGCSLRMAQFAALDWTCTGGEAMAFLPLGGTLAREREEGWRGADAVGRGAGRWPRSSWWTATAGAGRGRTAARRWTPSRSRGWRGWAPCCR